MPMISGDCVKKTHEMDKLKMHPPATAMVCLPNLSARRCATGPVCMRRKRDCFILPHVANGIFSSSNSNKHKNVQNY